MSILKKTDVTRCLLPFISLFVSRHNLIKSLTSPSDVCWHSLCQRRIIIICWQRVLIIVLFATHHCSAYLVSTLINTHSVKWGAEPPLPATFPADIILCEHCYSRTVTQGKKKQRRELLSLADNIVGGPQRAPVNFFQRQNYFFAFPRGSYTHTQLSIYQSES